MIAKRKRASLHVRTGAIVVHTDLAFIRERGARIVAIDVDLGSKRAGLSCVGEVDGLPAVWLERTEETIGDTRLKLDTRVAFADFEGWKIFCSEVSRCALRVTLVKGECE